MIYSIWFLTYIMQLLFKWTPQKHQIKTGCSLCKKTQCTKTPVLKMMLICRYHCYNNCISHNKFFFFKLVGDYLNNNNKKLCQTFLKVFASSDSHHMFIDLQSRLKKFCPCQCSCLKSHFMSSLTFSHRASSMQDRCFATFQRTFFIYLINKYISSDICLTVHH